MDRWKTLAVVCQGGLDLYSNVLMTGTQLTGVALQLQNYEPAVEGGYQTVLGYSKYDTAVVPGDADVPVTGTFPALGGVFAVRYNTTGTTNDIFFSSGAGWGSRLNGSNRTGSVVRSRFTRYSITDEVIIITDGFNPAWKYDGTETVINGTGAPADPKYACEHLNRLVLAGHSADPFSIILSAPYDDENYDAADGAIEIAVGDFIVGLKVFRGELYIFCQRALYKLVGNTTDSFQIVAVTKEIGCLSGDTIQEVGGDILYLAPDGIRSVAATERIGDIELALVSKSIQPLLRGLVNSFDENAFSSCVIRSKSQYRLFVYEDGVADSDTEGFLGKLENRSSDGLAYSWSTLKGFPVYHSASNYDDSEEITIFSHPTNGYVYRMERTNSFDGQARTFIYQTPYLFFDDPELRKTIYKIKVYTQVDGQAETTLSLKFDFEDPDVLQPEGDTLSVDSLFAVFGTAIFDTDTFSTGVSKPIFDINGIGSGFSVSAIFSDTNMAATHRIDSLVFEYSLSGRR